MSYHHKNKAQMTNFEFWYHHAADMPMRENGRWVDAEYGFLYNPRYDYKNNCPFSDANDTKAAEGIALAERFGGQPLTGSAKQQSWAEVIRFDKLSDSLLPDELEVVFKSPAAGSCSFWIDNKNKKSSEIFQICCKQGMEAL